jgi:uncharacterized protein YcbX
MADLARVVRINVTPVKGLGLQHPEAVELTERGVEANRRYYLTRDGLLFNGQDFGPLVRVAPESVDGHIALRFPDGALVEGRVRLGEPVTTSFWGRPVQGQVVEGPWADALSAYVGERVALVQTDEPGTGIDVHVGTLVGRASCERLGAELDAGVDARRFRMLLELDGLRAHEEDEWHERAVRVGGAVIRIRGPVPRCAVTTQDPDTGVPTLDTLRGIKRYRGLREGRKIDFGVYFDVEQPGRVEIGDFGGPLVGTPPPPDMCGATHYRHAPGWQTQIESSPPRQGVRSNQP